MGVVCKDKTFRAFKTERRHLFRIYNGWALNKILLEELKLTGIEWIEIHATDTGYIYRTSLQNFFNFGIFYQNKKGEKDPQIVLPLKFWAKFPMANKRQVKKVVKQITITQITTYEEKL